MEIEQLIQDLASLDGESISYLRGIIGKLSARHDIKRERQGHL